MLDLKFVRNNPQLVKDGLIKRNMTTELIDQFLTIDESRRQKLVVVEQKKSRRNSVSEEIGRLKKAGQNAEDLVLEMRALSQEIKEHD
ncbi:MAG: serine--tRNA ligase, partial [Peptococcia bacterium]